MKWLAEQRNIGSKYWLHKVQNVIAQEPAKESDVSEMRAVHRFGAHVRRKCQELLLKMLIERVKLALREYRITKNQEPLVAVLRDLISSRDVIAEPLT